MTGAIVDVHGVVEEEPPKTPAAAMVCLVKDGVAVVVLVVLVTRSSRSCSEC